ncbi:MAG TPA: MMPL family transporter, partial [Balneolaceae bacterium]|nr:MMPL family transporter [Balneolaceae bacterium]
LGNFAVQLKIDTNLANLLPEKNPHVLALGELQQTVGGETPMKVAIKSPSFEDNKEFAQDLIRQSLQLYDHQTGQYFFERAGFRKETKFLKNNALYFATPSELDQITNFLKDEIRNAKEEANPFLISFGTENESESTDISDFERTYDTLIPSEYPISEDSTLMVVSFYPTGSKSNLDYLENMFAAYDSLLATMNPQSYNPKMEVKFGGRLQRHLFEINSIMRDVFNSFASGITSVILLVAFYFFIKKYLHYRNGNSGKRKRSFWEHLIRFPVPVFVIGLPLLFSLAWTFGITYFVLGSLNTMTSVLFVILFGMGIDYGIHFYGRYIEIRSDGESVKDALFITYDNTGSALVVSALTTSVSLFVLVFAQFRGFSEFGFIAGTGIILALVCMLFVLPALLVIFERLNWILINQKVETTTEHHKSDQRFPWSRPIVIVGLLVSVLVVFNYQELDFQYDFGKLEPDYPEYQEFNRFAGDVSDSDRRNPAYILAENQRQVVEIMEEIRFKMKTDTTSPTILDVEALPERFPASDSTAQSKLQKIAQIRELLNDPFLKNQDDPQLAKLRQAAQTRQPLEISQIPDFIKNRFLTRSGEIGNFVIVYPSVGLSNGRKSIAFKDDVGKITIDSGETFYAASTSIIAAEMLELMQSEAPWFVGATFVMIFILMLFSLRSLRWTLVGMIPLVVGLLWLFGIMMIFGLMFNFYNIVVLPAILGIGDDSGIHLTHRYIEEGKNSMWDVLSSTGQHITMGAVTTMFGFAGLIFTNHPGLQSLGLIATIGIGMTLLAALTFLPALIQWLEDKNWIHYLND